MKYNFIIPYRNRKENLNEFISRFTDILKDTSIDAQFYIIHQMNADEFNRGALKNIGFLEISKIRPDGLFIFHDVDIYPRYWGSIDYNTLNGTIRHPVEQPFMLVKENLGLICCFWKEEFIKVNGFPNYYGWGIEDITIRHRAEKMGIIIDENNVILNNSDKCYSPHHHRDYDKQNVSAQQNTLLFNKEKETGDISNGLSNLDYEIMSSFELAPRFTILNVDFKF